MPQFHVSRWSTTLLLPVAVAIAQPGRPSLIPIRSLTIVAASDSGVLANITDVRELVDGRLLVNDRTRRQVVLLDAALSAPSTLIGEGQGALSRYGRPTRLLTFIGDSTAFVDAEARSLIVIGPDGRN